MLGRLRRAVGPAWARGQGGWCSETCILDETVPTRRTRLSLSFDGLAQPSRKCVVPGGRRDPGGTVGNCH